MISRNVADKGLTPRYRACIVLLPNNEKGLRCTIPNWCSNHFTVTGDEDKVSKFVEENRGIEVGEEHGLAAGETRELPLRTKWELRCDVCNVVYPGYEGQDCDVCDTGVLGLDPV